MQFFNESETESEIPPEHTYRFWQSYQGSRKIATIRVPKDSGIKVGFCRQVLSGIEQGSVQVQIIDDEIWPSSSNPFLFSLAVNLGVVSSAEYRYPVTMQFDPTDASHLEAVLYLCMCFYYECFILAPDAGVAYVLSHDEFLDVFSNSEDITAALRAIQPSLTFSESA